MTDVEAMQQRLQNQKTTINPVTGQTAPVKSNTQIFQQQETAQEYGRRGEGAQSTQTKQPPTIPTSSQEPKPSLTALATIAANNPDLLAKLPVGAAVMGYDAATGVMTYAPNYYAITRQNKIVEQHNALIAQQQKTSSEFYSSIGYPQYAGKFAAFDIKEGYKVSSITEVSGKLNVTFEPKQVEVKGGLPGFGATVEWFNPKTGERTQELPLKSGGVFTQTITPAKLSDVLSGKVQPDVLELRSASVLTSFVPVSIAFAPKAVGIFELGGFAVPKLFPFMVGGVGVAEAIKYGTTGKSLDVVEAFGAGATGVGVGYMAMQVNSFLGNRVSNTIKESWQSSPVSRQVLNVEYQFKQNAPEVLLKAVYGEDIGRAIAIERQWNWNPTDFMEEEYGAAFYRAETLHTPMPTTEMARLRYDEWLAPRQAIESSFGAWEEAGIGASIENAYGMPFYRAETLRMTVPTKEWDVIRFEEQLHAERETMKDWGWTSESYAVKAGEVVKVQLPSEEAFGAEQSLIMNMPTMRQVTSWYFHMQGFRQTPMSVTLANAQKDTMFDGAGLKSAPQQIGIQVQEEVDFVSGIPTAPVRLFQSKIPFTVYYGSSTSLYKTPSLTQPISPQQFSSVSPISETRELFGAGLLPINIVAQAEEQTQSLRVGQIQGQTQKQIQAQQQAQVQILIPSFPVPTTTTGLPFFETTPEPIKTQEQPTPIIPTPSPALTKLFAIPTMFGGGGGAEGRGKRFGYGLWFKRAHPIPSSKQMENNFLGTAKTQRTRMLNVNQGSRSLFNATRRSSRGSSVNQATRNILGSNRKSNNFFNSKQSKRKRSRRRG